MRKTPYLVIALSLIGSAFVAILWGQVGDRLAWTKLPWSGSDAPFAKIRHEVETAREVARSGDDCTEIKQLLATYRARFKSNPKDMTALFGFMTCVHETDFLPPGDAGAEDPQILFEALQGSGVPKTFEFVRMRWLYAQHNSGAPRELGERLLERDPADYEVMYYLIRLYGSERDPKLKARGFKLGDLIVKTFPGRPSAFAAQGDYNYVLGVRDKSWDELKVARGAFKKFLQLAPSFWKRDREIYTSRLANIEEKFRTGDISAWKH